MSRVIACDLDGTLAEYYGWQGIEHIGAAVQPIKDLIIETLEGGDEVAIFTARANDAEAIPYIVDWLASNGIPELEITCVKQKKFTEFWDDRAIGVVPNLGEFVRGCIEPVAESSLDVQVGGSHYKSMAIQPAEYCEYNGMGALESGVVKYVSRHKAKNGIQDIDKAIDLLNMIKDMQYSEAGINSLIKRLESKK